MKSLDEIINESRDSREVKRALSVKMVLAQVPTGQVCALLNVSPQYVSKWRLAYESCGASALLLGYVGSQSYLTAEEKEAISQWIQSHSTLTPEAVRDYVQEQYGVLYKSPQSYYDLLEAAGWSYHKSEKINPQREESLVQKRRAEIKKLAQHWQEIKCGALVVLLQDECHLLWGDVCGYAWGARNQPIEVPMTNQKQRQTYYGAVNFLTRQLHLKAFAAGNSEHTQAYLQWLMELYPDQKLLLLWDGATYHRDHRVKAFLEQVNAGLAEEDWRLTVCRFAPNAPEQNPVEEIWLAGKNHLRKCFAQNKTFAQVKHAFSSFLQDFSLQSAKFDWYAPQPQMI